MSADLDPTATSANLSDLVRALFLLLGVVVFGLVVATVLLLLRRWAANRPMRGRRPSDQVDPWIESARRFGEASEGDAS